MITKESFNKLNKKNEDTKKNYLYKFLFTTAVKILIVTILFLSSLIYIKQSDKNKEKYKNFVYNNSLSFAKIYSIYNQYLGDVVPFKNIFKDNTKQVSNEKITYEKIEKQGDGYLLTVSSEYPVSSVQSGIIIKSVSSDKYNNLITIQDKNGLNITYGYLDNLNVKLYDYVEKGEILGTANKKLYMIFQKDNEFLSYEKYL